MPDRPINLLAGAWQFARRDPAEVLLLARMAGWVLLLSALFKLLPLPRVLRLVAATPRPRSRRYAPERLAQLLDLLLGLNLFAFTPTCWKRAPVLRRYLALFGVETRIVFGVRKAGGDLLAGHAWLERDGQPVFEAVPPTYLVTYAYP
jgi:hypothetical protein